MNPHKDEIARQQQRLAELASFSDRKVWALEGEFRAHTQPDWQPMVVGQPWPSSDFPVYFRFRAALPPESPLHLRLVVGGEGLLLLDGRAVGGLNPYHREYPLPHDFAGQIEVEAVPYGPFGVPSEGPRLEVAQLVQPDQLVRALVADLEALLEAAAQVTPDLAQQLLDISSQTLALLRLPRSPVQAYLARVYATSSNARVWENWQFEGEPLKLDAESAASVATAREFLAERLQPLAQLYPSIGQIWLTGHAHIDLAWLWPLAETRRKIRRTYATLDTLMEQYPELYFNQSSAQAYQWLAQDDPQVFERVRQRIAEGRWEAVGGMWVEPDGNLLSGESWARQLLYGQRYFRQAFGVQARVAWLPDTFGFAANLPQLFQQAGLPYFFTTKLNWNETNRFPHDLWQWEGLDGSRVLAHAFNNPNHGYNGKLQALDLAQTWANFRGKRYHPGSLLAFGYGDGGGGPTAGMMERYRRYRQYPGLPQTVQGRVADYYDQVAARQPQLPVWVGEQYLELHRATYTTQSRLKVLNRQIEHALPQLDALQAILQQSSTTEAYWKTLLLNQFHDILPGSGVHTVAQEAENQLREALDGITGEIGNLLQGQADGDHLVIWNLSGVARRLQGVFPRPKLEQFHLQTPHYTPVAWQAVGEDQIAVASDLELAPLSRLVLMVKPGNRRLPTDLRAGKGFLENDYLRAEVGADGTLHQLWDMLSERQVLADRANQIWAYPDLPRYWEAWDVDASYAREGEEVLAHKVRLLEKGPVRARLEVVRRLGASTLTQIYQLWAGSPVLEVENIIDWQERRTQLRAVFPLAIRSHEAWFETAYGAVARPTHANTSWDETRFEVPALRWADLSEADYGVSLLNDGRYGHSARGNQLGLSLVRGPIWPDPLADVGYHHFTYALYPHLNDWRNGTVQQAVALNTPLWGVLRSNVTEEEGAWLPELPPGIGLSVLKPAEDGKALIMRLYEAHGGRRVVGIDLEPLGIGRVYRTNLLEDPEAELVLEEGVLHLEFHPFQVITLRLEA